MCQKRTDSQKPLSGACAKVQGQATAQLQLSNQSPLMCQLGISVMRTPSQKTPFGCEKNITNSDRELCRSLHPSGPSQCPLWVKSGYRGTSGGCPLYPESRHSSAQVACPLCAINGHRAFKLSLASLMTQLHWQQSRSAISRL